MKEGVKHSQRAPHVLRKRAHRFDGKSFPHNLVHAEYSKRGLVDAACTRFLKIQIQFLDL